MTNDIQRQIRRSSGRIRQENMFTFKCTCRHLQDLQGYCAYASGNFFFTFPLGSASPQSPLWTSRPSRKCFSTAFSPLLRIMGLNVQCMDWLLHSNVAYALISAAIVSHATLLCAVLFFSGIGAHLTDVNR